MRKRFTATLFIVAIVSIAALPIRTTEDESQKLHKLFDDEWQWRLREDPVFATMRGDLRFNDKISDYSLEGTVVRQRHQQEVLAKIKAVDRSQLSADDKINYDLFLLQIDNQVQGQKFRGYLRPINQRGGIHSELAQLADAISFRTAQDYRDYIARMHQFPKAIDDTIAVLKEGLKERITPPRITVREVGNQIRDLITDSAEASLFYSPFNEMASALTSAEKVELRADAKQVIEKEVFPAYKKLYEFWTKKYYPNTVEDTGLSAYPNGREWYSFLVKRFTTTDLTPDQIYEIGLKEVARIRAEMDKIIKDVGFKGTFEEFLHFLRTDPQFYYDKPEELVTGYRDICKRIDPELPRLFGKLPRLTYGVREIPAFNAPSQTTAYYSGGSPETGRPGWYYVNTYKLNTRPKYEMEALSTHESVPGHHLQIALAQELEGIPNFRKFSGITAFVEGWALYCESLGPELGLYKDPYSKFGQLTYEMWRAVRLVVDTGIHWKAWTRQQAIDYFKANAAKQENDIIVEIDRYISWPGQSLAYMIGALEIKKLRAYAEAELGTKFDIREFHDKILGSGPLPLSMLSQKIHDYVEGKK